MLVNFGVAGCVGCTAYKIVRGGYPCVIWATWRDPDSVELQAVSPFMASADCGPDVDDCLERVRHYIDGGQARNLPWLAVDPICILQSGGSNSFHEAIQ